MFILKEFFLLFEYVVHWCKMLTIFGIWGVSLYIMLGLFKGNMMIPTPFTNSHIVADGGTLNIDDFTTQNQEIPIIFSKYAPEIGDSVNCMYPCSQTASGELVSNYLDRGIACPMEIPHYTRIRIRDLGIFECVDKGGWIKIVQEGERDEALTNNQRYFNVQNNVGDPNVIVYAEETHMWIDLMTTVDKLDSYPAYKTLIYDWEIVTDTPQEED